MSINLVPVMRYRTPDDMTNFATTSASVIHSHLTCLISPAINRGTFDGALFGTSANLFNCTRRSIGHTCDSMRNQVMSICNDGDGKCHRSRQNVRKDSSNRRTRPQRASSELHRTRAHGNDVRISTIFFAQNPTRAQRRLSSLSSGFVDVYVNVWLSQIKRS